jgi:pantothenate kinase
MIEGYGFAERVYNNPAILAVGGMAFNFPAEFFAQVPIHVIRQETQYRLASGMVIVTHALLLW